MSSFVGLTLRPDLCGVDRLSVLDLFFDKVDSLPRLGRDVFETYGDKFTRRIRLVERYGDLIRGNLVFELLTGRLDRYRTELQSHRVKGGRKKAAFQRLEADGGIADDLF